MRLVGGLALLLGTSLLAGQAVASPPTTRVCHLITDARGDAGLTFGGPSGQVEVLPGGPTDDLLSADVASDGRTVTAVLRLAALEQPDPAAPTGHSYLLTFRVSGAPVDQFLEARTYPTGTQFDYGTLETDAAGDPYSHVAGRARGVLDLTRKEVRIHVSAALLLPRGKVRKGTVLIAPTAITDRWWGQGLVPSPSVAGVVVPLGGTGTGFDRADGGDYVVGTPSCVRPGV